MRTFDITRPRLSRRRFSALTASAAAGMALAVPSRAHEASPVATGPRLVVEPARVRFDEAFEITVPDLVPGQEVTIRSAFTDTAGIEWAAEATYAAHPYGFVRASGQRPVRGTFDVPDAMAFIWAAESVAPRYTASLTAPEIVTLRASSAGREIGVAQIERTILPVGYRPEYILTPERVGYLYPPVTDTGEPAPAVVLLGGSDGRVENLELQASLLAARGYAVLTLAYFGPVGGLPRALEEIPLEYVIDAIAWLRQQPGVRSDRVGVMGYSRGAELALLVGAHDPSVSAVVSVAGSGYVGPSLFGQIPTSAWTWQGEPLPWLDEPPWMGNVAPDVLARAEIPVERIAGPVLLVSGDADLLWPSTTLSRVAWDRLQRAGHPWPDQLLHYPGAGHLMSPPPWQPMGPSVVSPRPDWYEVGGDVASNAAASANAWAAIVAFFEAHVRFG